MLRHEDVSRGLSKYYTYTLVLISIYAAHGFNVPLLQSRQRVLLLFIWIIKWDRVIKFYTIKIIMSERSDILNISIEAKCWKLLKLSSEICTIEINYLILLFLLSRVTQVAVYSVLFDQIFIFIFGFFSVSRDP